MAYLTINDYIGLNSGKPEPDNFELLELRARQLIDRATHGRVRSEKSVRQSVKMAMVELIDALNADQLSDAVHGGREVSAGSNDGVSVSYASGGQTRSARYASIIRTWLELEVTAYGVPLLYAGVDA